MSRPKPTRSCAFFLYAESIDHPDTALRLFETRVAGHLLLARMDFVDSVPGLTGDASERRARCTLLQHSAQDCHRKSDNPQATPADVDRPVLRAVNGNQLGGARYTKGRQTRVAANSAISGCFYPNDVPMAVCTTSSGRHKNRCLPRIARRIETISLIA